MKSYKFLVLNFKIILPFLILFCFGYFSVSAWGYPIDSTDNSGAFSGLGTNQANQIGNSLNELVERIFGSKLATPNIQIQGISSDINKFIPKGYGLTFEDLLDIKSFSTKDILGSLRAVGILFIKLVITTLSVTLGILKLILDLLVRG